MAKDTHTHTHSRTEGHTETSRPRFLFTCRSNMVLHSFRHFVSFDTLISGPQDFGGVPEIKLRDVSHRLSRVLKILQSSSDWNCLEQAPCMEMCVQFQGLWGRLGKIAHLNKPKVQTVILNCRAQSSGGRGVSIANLCVKMQLFCKMPLCARLLASRSPAKKHANATPKK